MREAKKIVTLAFAAMMAAGAFTGCKKGAAASSGAVTTASEIYFLNFKPEIAAKYKKISDEYKQLKNVTVKISTAASDDYEQTLKSEIAKTDAPTIFQVNGPVGYASWKNYCADLKDWELCNDLTDSKLAIKNGDGIYGVPYSIEGYGIIYNNDIMKKYFALPHKKVSINSASEIKNFDTLKQVVEDMTAKKDALGIKGVFGSTSLKEGDQWRWQTHLANLPFYYEFSEIKGYSDTVETGLAQKTTSFKYNKNYKNIFDLYINNSVTDPKLLGSKSVADSMSEFALGQVAMIQNGNWAWSQIKDTKGNIVKADDILLLPIYTGVTGEEKQGICIGTENYFAINSKASAEKQKAAKEFLTWLFTSAEGKAHVRNDLGFIAPFTTFGDTEKPEDPLAKQVIAWSTNKNVNNLPWTFQSFPSETFKNDFGAALLQYAQGKLAWDKVTTTVVDSWKNEKA